MRSTAEAIRTLKEHDVNEAANIPAAARGSMLHPNARESAKKIQCLVNESAP
ncbi:hypothetical protein ABI062_15440 [Enterococcus faecium]|uniref:hypothetical protein n=1 Tax=Enterococcus faecium TaxID=1352 RepID=UPI003F437E80